MSIQVNSLTTDALYLEERRVALAHVIDTFDIIAVTANVRMAIVTQVFTNCENVRHSVCLILREDLLKIEVNNKKPFEAIKFSVKM